MTKHYRVYVVSDDSQCCGLMEFDAYFAVLSQDGCTLIVDGIKFKNSEGFRDLREGWVN